ncbi:MAG: hypothetical protein KAR40_09460 [Candidatus Sabulitectum sp.]|nr:hypothetical protein [Candidatus Sabulitectum sp.]
MMVVVNVILALVAAFPFADEDYGLKIDLCSSDLQARGAHSYDVLHYDVSIELFEDIEELEGIVSIHFQSEESSLDLIVLSVDSVGDSQGVLTFDSRWTALLL